MLNRIRFVQWRSVAVLTALITIVSARGAAAQGYVSPTAGYNFGGDSGCLTATNCDNKNWNFGIALGALGNIFGFETEFTYENNFAGSTAAQQTSVLTVMGDFMLAPKITIVQPYGLFGIGLIRTVFTPTAGAEEDDNNFGYNVGGGVIVYFNKHFGLKGDVRYYHAFEALSILGLNLPNASSNKLDFGRVGLGAVIKF